MSQIDPVEHANAVAQKERDDKAVCFNKTFEGQATPEQAKKTLNHIKSLCFADCCPAYAAGYETNRTLHFTGRQAVWREIEAILETQIKQTP